VREYTLDHAEREGGTVFHEWNMALYTPALSFWISTYLATSPAAVTIYTRDEYGVYQRYNCWMLRPSRAKGDITIAPGQRGFCRLIQRFSDLVAV
jgi:hypothetical protein